MSTHFDPIKLARKSEYYKVNHLGKVLCTLCNVYCNDEANFIKHLSGKVHGKSLSRREAAAARLRLLEAEEKRNEEAKQKAAEEKAQRDLMLLGNSGSTPQGTNALLKKPKYGVPFYKFRTDHDPVLFRTKVYLDITYDRLTSSLNNSSNNNGESGSGGNNNTIFYADTRPLHRWLTAREQAIDVPVDDYYIYLLIACEQYETICFKFPSQAHRSVPGELMAAEGSTAGASQGDGVAFINSNGTRPENDDRSSKKRKLEDGEGNEESSNSSEEEVRAEIPSNSGVSNGMVPAYTCHWDPMDKGVLSVLCNEPLKGNKTI